jgi:hypothetical protein
VPSGCASFQISLPRSGSSARGRGSRAAAYPEPPAHSRSAGRTTVSGTATSPRTSATWMRSSSSGAIPTSPRPTIARRGRSSKRSTVPIIESGFTVLSACRIHLQRHDRPEAVSGGNGTGNIGKALRSSIFEYSLHLLLMQRNEASTRIRNLRCRKTVVVSPPSTAPSRRPLVKLRALDEEARRLVFQPPFSGAESAPISPRSLGIRSHA